MIFTEQHYRQSEESVEASRQLLRHLATCDALDVQCVAKSEERILDSYRVLRRFRTPKYIADTRPTVAP